MSGCVQVCLCDHMCVFLHVCLCVCICVYVLDLKQILVYSLGYISI